MVMAKPVRCRGKWRIRWFDETGSRRSAVFPTYREAAYEQGRREIEVEEIKRGLRLPQPLDRKFDELCDYWLAHRTTRKRSPKDDRSIIGRHLRPAFGSLLLAEITIEPVDTYVAGLTHLTDKTVANHLTLFLAMLHMARDELRWVREVPKIRKPRVRPFQDHRYLKSAGDIDRFLRCASDDGEQTYMLYLAAISTGLRAGELAALRWADVDFDTRFLTIRHSYDRPTKSNDVRNVPILDRLLAPLQGWRMKPQSQFVFTNRDGRMFGRSARIFQEVLHRVLDRAGFESPEVAGRRRWYITFHDLRHTFASHWVMNGGDIFKLQKILGHKSIEMTMRYAHLAPSAFSGDYGRLGT
jgi:integrase